MQTEESAATIWKTWWGKVERLSRLKFLLLCVAVSFLVAVYFFCPRFALWNGLNVPFSYFNPEVNRAADTLKLLHNPYEKITNPNNIVVQWRWLFPLICHYLYFPQWLFLAVPAMGCLLNLLLVEHIAYKETGDRLQTWGITLLGATTSWFFVSTGWLCYFDSWYVFGLLVVAFLPTRRSIIWPCLLTPWVDERFVLALPVALLVRGIYFQDKEEYSWRKWWSEVVVAVAVIVPYLIVRKLMSQFGADHSAVVINPRAMYGQEHAIRNVFFGMWHGFRAMWIYVGLLFWLLYRYKNRLLGIAVPLVALGLFIVTICLAGDISRIVSMFFPLPVLGIILGWKYRREFIRATLPIALAMNLFLPARHVMASFTIPIFYLPVEWNRYETPPVEVNAAFYCKEAVNEIHRKNYDTAVTICNLALKLTPGFVDALINRSYANFNLDKEEDALKDADEAIRIDPKAADAYYVRGIVFQKRKELTKASEEFLKAMKCAPPKWSLRTDTNNRISQCMDMPK